MEPSEIGNYFPEFLKSKEGCKFHNCLHQKEPKCAIIDSVDQGRIAKSRYDSYLQMITEDNSYRN